MEPEVGEVWSFGRDSSNFLGLPGPCPWDDEDEPLGLGGIKPKSSPIPRRRSSTSSSSEDEAQPPPSSSRRVSFADAFGLSLVSVKQFDSWALGFPPDPLEGDLTETKEYSLTQLFTLPTTPEELMQKVQDHNLELESLELLPGTTTVRGIIRVLNLCFDKMVYIRTSLDSWNTHFDLLAEYMPGSSNGTTDSFSFRLTLVPPFGEKGARVDFCLRYETLFGTFWANNSGQNYVLFCQEKAKGQGENEKKHKRKSCLKSASYDCSSETSSTSSTEEAPEIYLNCEVADVTEPVAVKGEKTEEECMKHQEENIRDHSRRSRRKAARLAKIRQYFAEREEKNSQQTEKDSSEMAVMMNVEHPVLENVEALLNSSVPQTNISTEVSPSESEKNKAENTATKHVPSVQDKGNIPVIPSELTASISQGNGSQDSVNHHKPTRSSVSQALDISQNKETVNVQNVSVTQQLLECQNSEPSISKSVEKAWEQFEKGAMERIGSTMDTGTCLDTTSNRVEPNNIDYDVSENYPDAQSSGHSFTFETIVAPLYHQVFERLENEKRELSRESEHGKSVGNMGGRCLRAVTYQTYPRTQSVETRPNTCVSEKHVLNDVYHGACNEQLLPDSFNTKSAIEKHTSGTNVNTDLPNIEATLHDVSVTDTMEDWLNSNISEINMASKDTPTEKQQLASSLPSQLECLNRTHSLEERVLDQMDKSHTSTILQSGHFLDNSSEDLGGKSLGTTCIQSECPPENPEHEHVPVDYMILTTHPNLDKILVPLVSEKSSFTDSLIGRKSFETGFSPEIPKHSKNHTIPPLTSGGFQTPMASTFIEMLPINIGQEKSKSPVPQYALFQTHMSLNITPTMCQSESSIPPQSLTSLPLFQTQSPGLTSIQQRHTAGVTEAQLQVTESKNVTHVSDHIHHYIDREPRHFSSETESSCDRNNKKDFSPRKDINPEEIPLDKSSLNPLHISLEHQNKAFTSDNNCSEDFNRNFEKNKDIFIRSRNNNPTSVITDNEDDVCEEYKCVENPVVNKEQESTDNQYQAVHNLEVTEKTRKLEDQEEEQKQEVQKHKEEVDKEEEQNEEEEQNKEEQQKPKLEKPEDVEHNELDEEQEQERSEQDKVDQEELEEEDKLEDKGIQEDDDDLGNNNIFEDELLYIDDDDDDEEEEEEDMSGKATEHYFDYRENVDDDLPLEVETEKRERVSRVSSVATVEITNIDSFNTEDHLQVNQGFISGDDELSLEKDSSQQDLSGNSDKLKLTYREIEACFQVKNEQEGATTEVSKPLENPEDMNSQSKKNMDDSASTESVTDDEMELYLHRLKAEFRETSSNRNYNKRPSVSRTRTMPSPMPSISESVDEDQPNTRLEDLTMEEMTELEKATLLLLDEEDEVRRQNVLWWREVFSSINLSKMFGYTFLLVVFLMTAYYYNFIACFGLYLLALYWLYFRGESETLKVTQPET